VNLGYDSGVKAVVRNIAPVARKLSHWWLGLGLLVLPWVWDLNQVIAFEVPRVIVFRLWVVILLGLLLLQWRLIKIVRIKYVLLWVGVIILASLSDFDKAFAGNYYREDGLGTQIMLAALAVSVGLSGVAPLWLLRFQLLASLLVSLGVLLLWSFPILGLITPASFWWSDGSIGLAFGNPHFLAGYLTVSLALVVSMGAMIKKKWLWMTLALLHLLAIGLTQSFLFLGLGLVILLWRWVRVSKVRWFAWGLTGLFCVVFLVWVFRPTKTFDAESRARMWRRGAIAWTQKPFFGWGWAHYDKAVESVIWPYPVRFDIYTDKAHSSLMEAMVATGLVGLIAYTLLWWSSLRQLIFLAKKQVDYSPWLMGGVAFLLASQLNVISIMTEILGWMVVGFGLIPYKKA